MKIIAVSKSDIFWHYPIHHRAHGVVSLRDCYFLLQEKTTWVLSSITHMNHK